MAKLLEGRAALVTGGGQGVGQGIARALAEAGANVMIAQRNIDQAEAEAAFLRDTHGVQAAAIRTDVSVEAECEAMVKATHERFGRLDILVNNAGGSPAVAAESVSPRFVEAILKLNLVAPLHLAQAAHPHMVRTGGGSIVNIASVSGIRPSPGTAVYGAAKAGLLNLTQSLAQEWGPAGVRVNAIIAGLMQTETAEATYGDAEAQAAVGRSMPLQRMGTGADLAGAVLWLCSPLAAWVSGARINVDGGGERPYFLDLVKGAKA